MYPTAPLVSRPHPRNTRNNCIFCTATRACDCKSVNSTSDGIPSGISMCTSWLLLARRSDRMLKSSYLFTQIEIN